MGKVGPRLTPDGYELITVYAAIFFDGTKNNRYNTALARLKTAKAQQILRNVGGGDSFTNFYSNVSIMEEMNKRRVPAKFEVSVYVEGAGTDYGSSVKNGVTTSHYHAEDQQGYAFGSGPTGIRDKVTKGINFLYDAIKALPYNPKKQQIGEIKIDVFGFSRGAAAARHFISRHRSYHIIPGQPPATLTIKFVGLFDTVSSYDNTHARTGNAGRLLGHLGSQPSEEFSNDVAELGLAIGNHAKRVVHLVAADEYRLNFASTNIQSSINAGIGYEYVLPGVHSDIGGGYPEVEVEERDFYNDQERAQLMQEGWYTSNQVSHWVEYPSNGPYGQVVHHWKGERRVSHHYQFVSLIIMVLLATRSGLEVQLANVDENAMMFSEAQFRRYSVPQLLLPAAQQIKNFVLSNYHKPGRVRFPLNTIPLSKMLRNQYLHRSAREEFTAWGMGAYRDEKTHRLKRQPIQG